MKPDGLSWNAVNYLPICTACRAGG